jgi:hypothetical protein
MRVSSRKGSHGIGETLFHGNYVNRSCMRRFERGRVNQYFAK